MLALLSRFWNFLKSLVNLVLPVFEQATALRNLGAIARWALRLLLFAAILAGLVYLNTFEEVKKPYKLPFLREYYLPILFLLGVGIVWLGVLFWQLLTAEDAESDFPDIDKAWEEARVALEEAGIDLTQEPVFLVLGETVGGEAAFFRSAFGSPDRPLIVAGAPVSQPSAPVRVFVGEFKGRGADRQPRRGVFVTCAGTSLLARIAQELMGQGEAAPGAEQFDENGQQATIFATMAPKPVSDDVQNIVLSMGRQKRQPSPEEQEALRQLIGADDDDLARRARQARVRLFTDGNEVGRLQARLRHLCRLLTRDRRPWCPVNGALVLFPWTATDTQDIANHAANACRLDLETARQALGVHCPAIAVVADMETAPGFVEFIRRIPRENRNNRVGRSFDLNPDVRGSELTSMVAAGIQWFSTAMLTRQIYQFFDLERGENAAAERVKVVDGNVRLHQVLTQLLERQKRLSWLLTRGFLNENNGPPLFGGCYLAGTGQGADQQVFVAGVLHRLIEEQDNISWTAEAADDDRWYRRAAKAAWGAAVALLLGLAGLIVVYLRNKDNEENKWVLLALCVPLAIVVAMVTLRGRK